MMNSLRRMNAFICVDFIELLIKPIAILKLKKTKIRELNFKMK
jgi:hypothetical protein